MVPDGTQCRDAAVHADGEGEARNAGGASHNETVAGGKRDETERDGQIWAWGVSKVPRVSGRDRF